MTPTEQDRQSRQERTQDTFFQMKTLEVNARNQGILVFIGASTFVGAIIVAISVAQAKDVVRPVATQVTVNTTEIKSFKDDVTEIKSIQNETNSLLKSMIEKL